MKDGVSDVVWSGRRLKRTARRMAACLGGPVGGLYLYLQCCPGLTLVGLTYGRPAKSVSASTAAAAVADADADANAAVQSGKLVVGGSLADSEVRRRLGPEQHGQQAEEQRPRPAVVLVSADSLLHPGRLGRLRRAGPWPACYYLGLA